jgi:hypothetical protein
MGPWLALTTLQPGITVIDMTIKMIIIIIITMMIITRTTAIIIRILQQRFFHHRRGRPSEHSTGEAREEGTASARQGRRGHAHVVVQRGPLGYFSETLVIPRNGRPMVDTADGAGDGAGDGACDGACMGGLLLARSAHGPKLAVGARTRSLAVRELAGAHA